MQFVDEAMTLRARHFRFDFPRPTLVMGIVNVTPDSFSDGGHLPDEGSAVAYGLHLVAEGADVLDIGGESTRPGSIPVPEAEELRRVIPVIKGLAGQVEVPISVDTMKPRVAQAALGAGASIVNDVAANRTDQEMWKAVASSDAAYVCMHMQGNPQTMQIDPRYTDVVGEVAAFFSDRIQRLIDCGLTQERIILDPGIGFGKTLAHNLQLLGNLRTLTNLGLPLLLGVSRKSFMAKLLGNTARAGERLPAGLACACLAVEAGANMIRTHDVAETVQALRMAEAVLAKRKDREC